MTRHNQKSQHFHGPENAEHEIRKAYNCVVDVGALFLSERRPIPGVNIQEVMNVYKHAFNRHRHGNKLAAERWARAAKHLSRAFWHEAKIAYLEPRSADLPFLDGATEDEYGAYERFDTTADLIESVDDHIPPGLDTMPEDMKRYLSKARKHLEVVKQTEYKHELLRAERIMAAHEYGRVLECAALAYEAEVASKNAA